MKKNKIALSMYYKFIFVFVIFIILYIALGIYLSRVSISDKNSDSNWASWPAKFTVNFQDKIDLKYGEPYITDEGISELQKYDLPFILIDENGDVKLSYNEDDNVKDHYAPIEIAEAYKSGEIIKGYTSFVGGKDISGHKWTYIIAFPAKISKITMYFNYNNYLNVRFIVAGVIISFILFAIFYGIFASKSYFKIVKGIEKLNSDNYYNIKEKGIYKEVYKALNILNEKLRKNDKDRKRDQKLREEWIANVSHDLKTPLSPIKGYAEILSERYNELSKDDITKYGNIILKSAVNIENIVFDLNFTYQLKNGMIPLYLKEGNLECILKEVIIDILNDPQYENRNITFSCKENIILYKFDHILMKRAFNNLLINSVIHNSSETEINVSIERKDKVYIFIKDNGKGIESKDVERLFDRYYRGTNSKENIKGSGLGMSIAKQIIEAHNGMINVESKVGQGTKFIIILP